jgi:hypothetical protein
VKCWRPSPNVGRFWRVPQIWSLLLQATDIESRSVTDFALQEGQSRKTIVIRRVGRVLEMAWMEPGSLQTYTGIFEEHGV